MNIDRLEQKQKNCGSVCRAGRACLSGLGWSCSQSGPLGLSAYRHKNLANRTVIDLMVFLFKKKENERKKTSKEKKETREISYWKALWHARYTHSDTHTHTRVSMTSKGPGSDSASASTCASIRESAQPSACLVLWTASQVKWKTHQWKLKQKWQMVFCFFWALAWGLNLAVCRFRGVDGL